MTSSIKLFEW